jgi:hypothetical protein
VISQIATPTQITPSFNTWKIQRMELYEDSEYLNPYCLPIELGDIFEKSGGASKQYILLSQACDLMSPIQWGPPFCDDGGSSSLRWSKENKISELTPNFNTSTQITRINTLSVLRRFSQSDYLPSICVPRTNANFVAREAFDHDFGTPPEEPSSASVGKKESK